MAGVRKKPLNNGKYQGWFINLHGKRKFFTGTHNRKETQRIAERLEDDHLQYAVGYRPLPTPMQANRHESFDEVKKEYLESGKVQGGRGGHSWSEVHAKMRTRHLNFWQQQLKLNTMADLTGSLVKAERIVRELVVNGRAGKTVNNYIESLNAFCEWCIPREFLDTNPFAKLRRLDKTPKTSRRALNTKEIQMVFKACKPYQRLLIETAIMSGLRVNELRHLDKKHLDVKTCGLHLEARWTKNRKPGFQPLPKTLVKALHEFVELNGANQFYDKRYRRQDRPQNLPENPLLYVPTQPSRHLYGILNRAGVPKITNQGKVDFHACRVSYITLLIESGANIKEIQVLARHADLRLTLDVYAKTKDHRLRDAVEEISKLQDTLEDTSNESAE